MRKHTFELIMELASQDNALVAFSAYHAGYQIFQKDTDALLQLLQSMNKRLGDRRWFWEGLE